MDRIDILPDYYRGTVISCLAPLGSVDRLLLKHGATKTRHPASPGGEWPDHLAWGVDGVATAARLLLCGQLVGAAAVSRFHLERWTMHKAFNAGLPRRKGERSSDYVARVWSAPDTYHKEWVELPDTYDLSDDDIPGSQEPNLDHGHVCLSDGREICPAVVYGQLSEFLHARNLPEALGWDSAAFLAENDLPDDVQLALAYTVDGIALSIRQLRVAVAALAQDAGDAGGAAALREVPDTLTTISPEVAGPGRTYFAPPETSPGPVPTRAPSPVQESIVSPPLAALIPLLPHEGLDPAATAIVEAQAAMFEAILKGTRPAGRLFRDDEFATYNFAWHRALRVRSATRAMQVERQKLGPQFDLQVLDRRATAWVLLTEVTALLGNWHPSSEAAAALKLIGSGLRSAYWLWLEDDDRSMSVLRSVLEQVARLRTWRLKPTRARRLEVRPTTTPRDWLEASGLGRLSALNRALGEFAHARRTSRWKGAHDVLAQLQPYTEHADAIYTARGASIDLVAQLAARENVLAMRVCSDAIATTTSRLLQDHGFHVADELWLEQVLKHTGALQKASFGEPSFVASDYPVTGDDV